MSILHEYRIEVLEVVAWDQDRWLHRCRDEDGCERRIDLHVHGADLPEREALVGKTVRIEGSQAYVEIALRATLVLDEESENSHE